MKIYFSIDDLMVYGKPKIVCVDCDQTIFNVLMSERMYYAYFPVDLHGEYVTVRVIEPEIGCKMCTDGKYDGLCDDIIKYGTILSYAPVSFDYDTSNWRDKMDMGRVWKGGKTQSSDEVLNLQHKEARCIMRVRTPAWAYFRFEKGVGILPPWNTGMFRKEHIIEFFIHIDCRHTRDGKILTKFMFCRKPIALVISDNYLTNTCINNILRGTAENQRCMLWRKEGRKAVTAVRELKEEDIYQVY